MAEHSIQVKGGRTQYPRVSKSKLACKELVGLVVQAVHHLGAEHHGRAATPVHHGFAAVAPCFALPVLVAQIVPEDVVAEGPETPFNGK